MKTKILIVLILALILISIVFAYGGRSRYEGESFYVLHLAGATFNPVDATTYYIGSLPSLAPSTTSGYPRMYIPRSGTIRKIYGHIFIGTTRGTTETSTLYLRYNSTTDTVISSAIITSDASWVNPFSNTNLSISVTEGSFIELKWVTPTWATNPLAVFCEATILIE